MKKSDPIQQVLSELDAQFEKVSLEERLKDTIRDLFFCQKNRGWAQALILAREVLNLLATKLLEKEHPEVFQGLQDGTQDTFFPEQLFCGGGDASTAYIGLLHLLLDRALTELSGCQQLSGYPSVSEEGMEEFWERSGKLSANTIQDITMALTGKTKED